MRVSFWVFVLFLFRFESFAEVGVFGVNMEFEKVLIGVVFIWFFIRLFFCRFVYLEFFRSLSFLFMFIKLFDFGKV